jgi:hypothetical protein
MVLRLLVAMGMLVLTAPLGANVIPKTVGGACGVVRTTLQRERTFPTVVATVDAMAREHLAASVRADREYVGAVLQDGEGRYWAAVGVGCAGQDTVTFAIGVPAGLRVSAFWHTHGAAGPLRDWFSPDDVELVASTGYDFYLIRPSGALRVLSLADVQRSARHAFRTPPPGLPRRATIGRAVAVPDDSDGRVTAAGEPGTAAPV